MSGDAWRYAPNLQDPEAVRLPLHAALTAHQTIAFAQREVTPEQFATVPDWRAMRRGLHAALAAAGHPAGATPPV